MNTPYRVLVTGSRDWTDVQAVRQALMQEWLRAGRGRPFVVVQGECEDGGADLFAKQWAEERKEFGVISEGHAANWRPNGFLDRAAGPRRNALMVNLGADKVLAFIGPCTSPRCHQPRPHDSHGATGCAKLAEKHEIPVDRHYA